MLKIETLEQLCECAATLSANTQGRQVQSWREAVGSLIFAKQTVTCMSLLRLVPGSSHYAASGGRQVWDVSSSATLCRNIVESYLTFYYVAVDQVSEPENLFRESLWEYHAAFERYEMFRITTPHSTHLAQIKTIYDGAKTHLEGTVHFQTLNPKYQIKLLEGKQFRVLDNVGVCLRAGISEAYYRGEFKYLSAYAHSAPFSISQGAVIRAGTPDAEQLFKRIFQSAIGWMAVAIRDFVVVFPDQASLLTDDVRECIGIWQELFKWNNLPGFKGYSDQAERP